MLFKNKTHRNYSKKKIIFLFISSLLLFFLISVSVYAIYLYDKVQDTLNSSYEEVQRDNKRSSLRDNVVNPIKDNVSILLIGVDDSKDRNYKEHSRSDALILGTFNRKDNSINLLSIPRDSHVYVPELGYHTKINHAHFYGGPKATIEAVENFMNVPVDYYVRFNFEAFIEIIDSLGGIYFDVPFELYEPDSHDNKNAIHLMPGYQKINGEQALALVRSRKYDNDIERSKRQQEMIRTIFKEATSTSSIFKLGDIIRAVGSNMKTNLSFAEIKSFASYGLSKAPSLTSLHLKGFGGYLDDGLWYYQVDERSREAIEKELLSHLGITN
ncbi:LCP family protein [Ornithinibacillus bavariensis]|uniref:Transcriptional regulator n=1 Tax=Ornithinibacillus bavariensis TaxID=545502 RepID=A0A919X6P4_9BACI|nr:LCP family protein [Ornithinibacillus bavariensis]GIO26927.1 transcriptional regulator [Ornithinibacillus bavariensis]